MLERAVLHTARAQRGVVNGLWLGLLSDERLKAVDELYYDGEYLYRTEAWNDRGLFPWEEQLIGEYFQGRSRVLVAACGGGREVLALLGAGFDAHGCESHPALAEYGRELLARRGHPDRITGGPRDGLPPATAPWDGIVVGWGAYSLVHGRARRIALLAQAREQLVAGGPLLLSFFDGAAGRRLRLTRAIAAPLRRARGARPLETGDTLAPNLVHVFTRERLAEELAAAGFELTTYGVVGQAQATTRYAAAVGHARP